jgi:Holliday junction resolvase RusA-like endonuclease
MEGTKIAAMLILTFISWNAIFLMQPTYHDPLFVSAFPSTFFNFMTKGASSSSCHGRSFMLSNFGSLSCSLFKTRSNYDTLVPFHILKATLRLPATSLVVDDDDDDDDDLGSDHVAADEKTRNRTGDGDDNVIIQTSQKKRKMKKSTTTTRSSRKNNRTHNDEITAMNKVEKSSIVSRGRNSSNNKAKGKSRNSSTINSKKVESNEPIYFYRNETDVMTILKKDGDNIAKDRHITMVKFRVRGNPIPLARHRSYRGFMFNPSAKKQRQFCSVVLDMMPDFCFKEPSGHCETMTEMGGKVPNSTCGMVMMSRKKSIDNVIPIFQNQVIAVQIISRMKRPKRHFVANKPGPGRLREESRVDDNGVVQSLASQHLQVTRTDVDNLAKFVLDSLNGVLYDDDRQVASLHVMKVYDHEEPYSGSTDVIIRSMTREDFQVVV